MITDYRTSLIGTESGGNWAARNNEVGAGGKSGHFGRVQFGHARLQEAMDAGAIPQGVTPEQFMASPELQMAAENWHFADLERRLGDLVGREVNGQVMDLGALVAMGHLGGAGGARKYVESGGRYNPSDSFGTSLSDYAKTHGGKASAQSDYARGALGGSYGGKSNEGLPSRDMSPADKRLAWAYANGKMTPEDEKLYEQGAQEGLWPKIQKAAQAAKGESPLDIYAQTALSNRSPLQYNPVGVGLRG